MFQLTILFALFALEWTTVLSAPAQAIFQAPVAKPRKLHGRFLQVTDLHPDPYYKAHTSIGKACHGKKKKKQNERAGYFGTSYSGCDSPFTLTNFTLDYLEKKWASEVDFVIWTGDNARHDNDRKLPRTPDEIYDLNRAVAAKMEKIFTSRGIPVIPSLGNNDVWPHNIMSPGPNSITNEFASIWKSFIPFPHLQVFQRGAYFSVEVIPDTVAVISLNTMYFYDSNKAVGGCEFNDRDDPGNLQFDWLAVQLKSFRSRNMQVWLSGHVPPSPGNFFPECYVRYVELSLRFQDTILGHLYGHMNADHFFFLEASDLNLVIESAEPEPGVSSNDDLYKTLLQDFSALPKSSKKTDLDNYAVINVSPPVVPNPYLPSFRVFAYNVSGSVRSSSKRKHGHPRGGGTDKDSLCKKAKYQDSWKCHLKDPWHSDPDSPSRTNQRWTPLGYAQYYIPDLDDANKTHKPKFKLEYLTLPPSLLHPPPDGDSEFQHPFPLRNLPKSLRKDKVTDSKYTPYHLPDLTIRSWVELGRRLAETKHGKLRKRFRKYMYLGSETEG